MSTNKEIIKKLNHLMVKLRKVNEVKENISTAFRELKAELEETTHEIGFWSGELYDLCEETKKSLIESNLPVKSKIPDGATHYHFKTKRYWKFENIGGRLRLREWNDPCWIWGFDNITKKELAMLTKDMKDLRPKKDIESGGISLDEISFDEEDK